MPSGSLGSQELPLTLLFERPLSSLTATAPAYSTGALPRLAHSTGKMEIVRGSGKDAKAR